MSDSSEGPVWLVNRKHPTHRIYFPGRENAERWLNNYDPADWRIVPVAENDGAGSSVAEST